MNNNTLRNWLNKACELFQDKKNGSPSEKVDIKSKKVKLIAFCSALVLLIAVIIVLFTVNRSPDPVWVDGKYQSQLNFINALDDNQKREFFLIHKFCIDNKIKGWEDKIVPRKGKKYSELVEAWREQFGPENCKKIDKFIESTSADAYNNLMAVYVNKLKHYIWAETEGRKMLTQKYDVECIEVNVWGWNQVAGAVWMDAVAVFRRDSGAEFKMNFEVRADLNREMLIFNPKEE